MQAQPACLPQLSPWPCLCLFTSSPSTWESGTLWTTWTELTLWVSGGGEGEGEGAGQLERGIDPYIPWLHSSSLTRESLEPAGGCVGGGAGCISQDLGSPQPGGSREREDLLGGGAGQGRRCAGTSASLPPSLFPTSQMVWSLWIPNTSRIGRVSGGEKPRGIQHGQGWGADWPKLLSGFLTWGIGLRRQKQREMVPVQRMPGGERDSSVSLWVGKQHSEKAAAGRTSGGAEPSVIFIFAQATPLEMPRLWLCGGGASSIVMGGKLS